ncbi:hypothetical protein GCM10007874_11140 [Labrys miyagiensis]|uniref:Uncharacterized protein n=1 Tax=Labrys miyagiensis TaxID=346912 RepID=A0ABQ6CEL1_9HYPH|nr:hypothetical protein GCM10007874_11140 [Labrys miyagiensis]
MALERLREEWRQRYEEEARQRRKGPKATKAKTTRSKWSKISL